jgi:hypothetical protein
MTRWGALSRMHDAGFKVLRPPLEKVETESLRPDWITWEGSGPGQTGRLVGEFSMHEYLTQDIPCFGCP